MGACQSTPDAGKPSQQFASAPTQSAPAPTAMAAIGGGGFSFQGGSISGGAGMLKSKAGFYQSRGKKKAMFIGINYIGTSAQLAGCINDVHNMYNWMTANYDFDPANVLILTDDNPDPNLKPTKANVLKGLAWLVKDAANDDSLFLHYSGHGGTASDYSGDEIDGTDQTICPVDYQSSGQIVDDDLFNILVKPLPTGCHLTCLFDSCHSGSVLDLPYMYTADGGLDELGAKYMKKTNLTPDQIQRYIAMRRSDGTVVQFAGCEDSQTSADAIINGQRTGAASWAFQQAMARNRTPTYTELLASMRDVLRPSFQQVMQMSTSQKMIMEQPFTL